MILKQHHVVLIGQFEIELCDIEKNHSFVQMNHNRDDMFVDVQYSCLCLLGPKLLKLTGRENWRTLFIEKMKPLVYELRRRARIAQLVRQREEAIARKKFE
jgi:hypothetical protein